MGLSNGGPLVKSALVTNPGMQGNEDQSLRAIRHKGNKGVTAVYSLLIKGLQLGSTPPGNRRDLTYVVCLHSSCHIY